MKVYAEYYKLPNGVNYRRKTLLQFGNSLKLVGSAVLINPGSAKSIGEADIETITTFYTKNHLLDLKEIQVWKEFSVDSTMFQLEKVFNGWYIGKPKELNGIIQLFNCFYYKNQDLDKAVQHINSNSSFNFNESTFFKDKPVYFGWGNTGKTLLKEKAKEIFLNYDLSLTPIYDPTFENNPYYHPGYVNRSYKSNPKTLEILRKFNALYI